jgi:hypothetical protein
LRQQRARNGSERDAHRRLARARAFEHVAQIVVSVLDAADPIGMAGARNVNLTSGRIVVLGRLDAHDLGPPHVILVLENERDRAADRDAAPHAPDDPHLVGLDVLPVPAPEAELPAPRLREQQLRTERQPARNPFDDPNQRRPVRLTRRQKPQSTHAFVTSPSVVILSLSKGPNHNSNVATACARNIAVPGTIRIPRARASITNGVSSGM